MLKLIIFSIIFSQSLAFNTRIVNGTDAVEGEFPFAVSLRINDTHVCGATILNENYILTAAHCACNDSSPLLDAAQYSIQYGRINITTEHINTIPIAKITCNNFTMASLLFDSAVLELNSSLPVNSTWERVTLAKTFNASFEQTGIVIGWGGLTEVGPISEILQKLNVTIYDDQTCASYNGTLATIDTKHHICFGADNAGVCYGDSGGALIVNGTQVGIASFITAECGISNPQMPNVYARVEMYYDWIASIAGDINYV